MFWFSATLHLFSSGQVLRNDCNTDCCSYDLKLGKVNCDNCCGYSIHYTPHIGIAILFHLFGCYWATQFFIACSSTVIAGSVASYYWARGEISVSELRHLKFTLYLAVSLLLLSTDYLSYSYAAWHTICYSCFFNEAVVALQPWFSCYRFTCCICCWVGAVYTRMPQTQVEASWFRSRKLLWENDIILFSMLPGLHRLDPQVCESKCLYNGKHTKILVHGAIAPWLKSIVSPALCWWLGVDAKSSGKTYAIHVDASIEFIRLMPFFRCCRSPLPGKGSSKLLFLQLVWSWITYCALEKLTSLEMSSSFWGSSVWACSVRSLPSLC